MISVAPRFAAAASRELEVGRVLVDGVALDRHAGRLELRDEDGRRAVEVAHEQVRHAWQRHQPPRAAVSGDDEVGVGQEVGIGRIA